MIGNGLVSTWKRMETGNLKFDRKRSRVKFCPCGKSNLDGKFVPYQGYDDKGYCHACGETFLPELENKTVSSFHALRKQETPTSYISHEIFKKSLSGYENNAFAQFLIDRFGDSGLKVIGKYFVGTTKSGGTTFWQIDKTGKIRSGKIIQYDQMTGKRLKNIAPSWVHSAMRLDDYNLKQCLFGEHLLRGNAKQCAIVESEKTACISSIYFPEMVWLACGGLDGLSTSKMQVLTGRPVILFPDLDGFGLWTQRAKELEPMLQISVSDLLESKATPEERNNKLDIADYLLRFKPEDFHKKKDYYVDTLRDGRTILMHPEGYPADWNVETPLQKLIKKNPLVAELVRRFDLQVLN